MNNEVPVWCQGFTPAREKNEPTKTLQDDLPSWLKLKALPDGEMHWRSFSVSVVGVTHRNPDRTDRQEVIYCCEEGESVELVRQPDNKHDRWAIAVFRWTGEQIGYLPGGDFLLASHMDQGGKVRAKILRITDGGTIGCFERSYGCVLEIGKWVPDPSKMTRFWEEAAELQNLLNEAKTLESTSPDEAISRYVSVTNRLRGFDLNPVSKRYRAVKYPINRLSLVLERQQRYVECYLVIRWWQKNSDPIGLTASDAASVGKRLKRVIRHLSTTQQSECDDRAVINQNECPLSPACQSKSGC